MTDPTEWGAQPVEDDPRKWGAEPVKEDVTASPSLPSEYDLPVFGKPRELTELPSLPSEYDLPEAFQERMRQGMKLERAMKRISSGIAEGWGDEPIGLSPEHVQQLQDAGVLTDYARYPYGRFGAISILKDAGINATANAIEMMMRGGNAGIRGAGAVFGHLVEELTGSETEGNKAENDIAGMGQFALIESGMGRFHRPEIGRDQIIRMQPIGGLPTEADFKTAAQAMNAADPLRLATEENLRNLWQERGIHPAEAVADAEHDAFLRADLTHPDPNAPDRSGLAQVTSTPMPVGTPRSELAKTGEAHIDALLDAAPVKQALDSPVIDRSGDVPGGVDIIPPEGQILFQSEFHKPPPDYVEIWAAEGRMVRSIQKNDDPVEAAKAEDEFLSRADAPFLTDALQRMQTMVAESQAQIENQLSLKKPEIAKEFAFKLSIRRAVDEERRRIGEYTRLIDKIKQSLVPKAVSVEHSAPTIPAPTIPVVSIDRRLPTSLTIDGATFDPAEPLAVRVTVERAAAQALTKPSGGFVAYHGSPYDFGAFDATKTNQGIWLAEDQELAARYRLEQGKLYRVNINASIDRLIDSGKSVDQQSESVRNAIAGIERDFDISRRKDASGQTFYADLATKLAGDGPLREGLVKANNLLRDRGVPGITYGPAHVIFDEKVIDITHKDGMPTDAAARVAQEYGAKAESAWYTAHGIDQAKAEEALRPFVEARAEPEKPAAADRAQAKEILTKAEENGELQPPVAGADLSAAVTPPGALPTPAAQPLPRPGSLTSAMQTAGTQLLSIKHNIQMMTSPMVTGSQSAMAIAKDFANAMRRNRWEWNRIDRWVVDNPDLKAARDRIGETAQEQRKRMWDAVDEEGVLRQQGMTNPNMGLATLEPEEQAVVADLHARSIAAWQQAVSLGMVDSTGLPSYAPRMLLNLAEGGDPRGLPLDVIGRNLRVRTGQMLHREHLEAQDTEAAAKQLVYNRRIAAGDTPAEAQAAADKVAIARDIRSLPLATAKLEDAIAGRILINAIEAAGRSTGRTTVSYGSQPNDAWFTIPNHPAFYRWQPRFEQGTPKLDANGDIIFDRVPIFVSGDFKGPLQAVLTRPSGALYSAMMSLKGKTMGLIMNSPIIHNAVEWGRAMPAMPGKVLTFRVYFEGNRAKNDPAIMREAIDGGLVPIGHRFFNQDINAVMEEPNLAPGRSWTAQIARFIPDLFDPARPGQTVGGAGDTVAAKIDKWGDIWHNKLLWDRVGDLQMGLYVNFRDSLLQQGVDRLTATRVSAHWANRYAGALPAEAMSDGARKIANSLLFSRSFTMGNLGAMKDMLTGLPKDVMAQIERDTGGLNPAAADVARKMARRKAVSVVLTDIVLMYVVNSILQSSINVLKGDKTLDKEMSDYAQRFHDELQEVGEHPMKLLFPLPVISEAMNMAGHVSSTYENEPGKQDRVRVGYSDDGRGIYMRNPVGKIGEEFTGYLTGPLDMIKRKLGTIARPGWEILSNDKGFGDKVYDPNAKLPADQMRNAAEIAKVIAGSQLPEGQIGALSDLVTGDGDATVNALQAFGPIGGFTFSQGAQGGPAMGQLYHAKSMYEYRVQLARKGIRQQIQRGDVDGARAAMTELGMSPALQRYYIRTTQNPALRLSPRALRDFQRYAPPADRQRMEELRQ